MLNKSSFLAFVFTRAGFIFKSKAVRIEEKDPGILNGFEYGNIVKNNQVKKSAKAA